MAGLIVHVQKARHLSDQHIFVRQRPYVVLRLDNVERTTDVTRRYGGSRPVWNEHLYLPVDAQEAVLQVSCFSRYKDSNRTEHFIGRGTIDLSLILSSRKQTAWVRLERRGKPTGEIFVELTHIAEASKPLLRPRVERPALTRSSTATSKRKHGELGQEEKTSSPASKRLPVDTADCTPHSSWLRRNASPRLSVLSNKTSFTSAIGAGLNIFKPIIDKRKAKDGFLDYVFVDLTDLSDADGMPQAPSRRRKLTSITFANPLAVWLNRTLKMSTPENVLDNVPPAVTTQTSVPSKVWNTPRLVHWKTYATREIKSC